MIEPINLLMLRTKNEIGHFFKDERADEFVKNALLIVVALIVLGALLALGAALMGAFERAADALGG